MDAVTAQELARRADACKGFRWMERMREEHGATCCKVLDGEPWLWFVDDCVTEHEGEGCSPDLDDPATLGCFEHGLLPAAWGPDAIIQVTRYGEFAAALVLLRESGEVAHQTGNETTPVAEALVCALEAAP